MTSVTGDRLPKGVALLCAVLLAYFLVSPPLILALIDQFGSEAPLLLFRPVFAVLMSDYGKPLLWYFNSMWGGRIIVGMNTIGFRLDERMKARAIASGGVASPECGKQWISFTLFRDDWPKVDIEFWARKAYVAARELAR